MIIGNQSTIQKVSSTGIKGLSLLLLQRETFMDSTEGMIIATKDSLNINMAV